MNLFASSRLPDLDAASEDTAHAVGRLAEDQFRQRRMLCAEAVVHSLNTVFSGPLDPGLIRGLSAAFPEGGGGAGCMCGAVSGALMGVGLMLGEKGVRQRVIRTQSKWVHDAFREKYGSTCCRVLSKKAGKGSANHFEQCATLTGEAARLAAAAVLGLHPELALADEGLDELRSSPAGRSKGMLDLFKRVIRR